MIDFLQMNGNLGEILNTLARECINARLNYQYAARAVRSRELAPIFETYAQEREVFVRQLDRLAASLNTPLYVTHDVPGLLRDFRGIHQSSQAQRTDLDWVHQCLDHEAAAMHEYNNALNERLPVHVYGFVRDQYEHIIHAHDALEQLVKSYQYWSAAPKAERKERIRTTTTRSSNDMITGKGLG